MRICEETWKSVVNIQNSMGLNYSFVQLNIESA